MVRNLDISHVITVMRIGQGNIDANTVMRIGQGKKHDRYWIGDSVIDTTSTPTLS
jgi:hypothetical protein